MAIAKLNRSPRSVVHKIIDVSEDANKMIPAAKPPKRVVIAEELNIAYLNTQWTKSETIDRWYTKSDYKHFKQLSRELSQQIVQREGAMMDRCSSSYANVVLRLFRACKQLAKEDTCPPPLAQVLNEADRQVLCQRMAQSHGRLGLDCVPGLDEERAWRRHETIWKTLSRPGHCQVTAHPSERFAHYLASALEVSLAQL